MATSKRLDAILELIAVHNAINGGDDEKVLADIGTDHAYLPIEACRTNICTSAIACDINAGPLQIANKNIQLAGFSDKIQTRLGDGLAPVMPGEAHYIVIAGMGGMRIVKILQTEAEKSKNALLVLQPQHDLEYLRRNLHVSGYEIKAERLVQEDKRFYVVLAAYYCGVNFAKTWSDEEYYLGKFLIEEYLMCQKFDCSGLEFKQENSTVVPDFKMYCMHLHDKILKYIQYIDDVSELDILNLRLEWINKFL